jgi:hypothetical protein
MRHLVPVFVVLAAMTLTGCGESTEPRSVMPPPTTPTTPTPQPLTTYTLSGVVKEAWIDTGLPGATVTIATGPSRGTAMTDAQGRYTLPNLLPGVYSVTFSKSLPYGSITYGPVNVPAADASFSGALSLTGGFPVTAANLQGYWVAQGPYPYEPCWILLFQNGTRLEGWYKDGRDYSTAMSGSRAGDAVSIDVGVSGLRIEGRVEDERCIRGFIRNDALGGNFPVAISRGGSCAR